MIRTRENANLKIAVLVLTAFTFSLVLSTEAWSKPRRSDRHGPGAFPDQLLEEVGVDKTIREEISQLSFII